MNADPRLSEMFDLVIGQGGSDLHLSAGGPPMIRVSGALVPLTKYGPLASEDVQAMLKSIVPPERWDSFMQNQNIDIAYAYKADARFRVNGYCAQGTTAVAFRLIPRGIQTFTELNLPSILEVFTQKEQGFFLCVGPVGQGKSDHARRA